jgi:hypothetical protein
VYLLEQKKMIDIAQGIGIRFSCRKKIVVELDKNMKVWKKRKDALDESDGVYKNS